MTSRKGSSKEVLTDPMLRGVAVRQGYKVLGPCALRDLLGRGAMGAVYSAWHANLRINVAVKCLTLLDVEGDSVKRFRREARAAAQVQSDHVVRVYDVSEHQGVHYIIMELVDGADARDHIRRRGPCAPDEAVRLTLAATRGLAAAHEKGVIHRDIKPSNIMIASDGTVKIADLGLARTSLVADSLQTTRGMMGTPAYMPPEQFDDAGVADASADVWSMGAVLYFLLTGENGNSAPNIFRAREQATEGMPRLPARRREPWRQLDGVIQRCTQSDPLDRFADASALAEALERCLGTACPSTTRPAAARARKRRRRLRRPPTRALIVGGSAVVGVLLIWAAVSLLREDAPDGAKGVVEVEARSGTGAAHAAARDHSLEVIFVPGLEGYEIHGGRVLIRDFYLSQHEVTNAQYARFLAATGARDGRTKPAFDPGYHARDDFPVIGVGAEAAREYCHWLGGDLPTEDQWEYAARGGNAEPGLERLFPWGDGWPDELPAAPMNYSGFRSDGDDTPAQSDGYEGPAPVGSFPSGRSPLNTLDQAGNVREWCRTRVADVYVMRGGGWQDPASKCRSRVRTDPTTDPAPCGFRVAFDKPD